MKLNTLVLFILLLVNSCSQPKNFYLDKNTLIAFNKNDTLVYKGVTSTDTFAVSSIARYIVNSDKIYNTETLDVNIPETSRICTSYCWGIHIFRQGSDYTSIGFRNTSHFLSNTETSISNDVSCIKEILSTL